jgi:hypothetical protein
MKADHRLVYARAGYRPVVVDTMEIGDKTLLFYVGKYVQEKTTGYFIDSYAAYEVGGDGPFDRFLFAETSMGKLKARVKKMYAPAPKPAPVPAARLPHGTPTIAEQVGLSLSTVYEIVEAMAALERQRRVAQALVTHQQRAAQAYRQRMIAAGRLKPAQETA